MKPTPTFEIHNRNWWREKLPLIQAWANGLRLQYRHAVTGKWQNITWDPDFSSDISCYRIHPDDLKQEGGEQS